MSLQSGFDDWSMYAYSYRRAADALVEWFPVPVDAPDAMFLPILFLYRHYVEAALKGILADCITAFAVKEPVPTHHKINELWTKVRLLTEARTTMLSPEWFDRAEQLISQLAKADPESMHFRYPVDKRGGRLLRSGFQVSPLRIREGMQDLFFVLDNLAGGISAIVDFPDVDSGAGPAPA